MSQSKKTSTTFASNGRSPNIRNPITCGRMKR
jgi:hypothetical protein